MRWLALILMLFALLAAAGDSETFGFPKEFKFLEKMTMVFRGECINDQSLRDVTAFPCQIRVRRTPDGRELFYILVYRDGMLYAVSSFRVNEEKILLAAPLKWVHPLAATAP